MNIWENAVITNKGLSLQAKLIQGTSLNITRAVVGAGYVTPAILQHQTAVSDIKQELRINPASYPETGKCAIPAYLTNNGLETGYTATQVGFYATDPDEGEILYFICQAESGSGTIVPSETEMPGYNAEWTFYFQYGQADDVTVTVDPANAVTVAQIHQMVIPIVTASSTDGVSYTATVPYWTELKKGCKLTVIPDKSSTVVNPTLNVNGFGDIQITRRQSMQANAMADPLEEYSSWFPKLIPLTLMYIGSYWILEGSEKPFAEDLFGQVPVAKGGTGSNTAFSAIKNLGGLPLRDFRSADYDMDKILVYGGMTALSNTLSRRHCYLCETSDKTLGTPAAYGVTELTSMTILSFNNGYKYGFQVAFVAGSSTMFMRNLVNDVISDWTSGYLPLTGGDMTGDIYMGSGKGRITANAEKFQTESWNVAGDDSNRRLLSLHNSTSKAAVSESLILIDRSNSLNKDYRVYGEHNKTTGTYTGNGSATSRTINTGGIGKLLLVWSSYGMVLISPAGAICKKEENLAGISGGKCYYENGYLTIITESDYVNRADTEYHYQCL